MSEYSNAVGARLRAIRAQQGLSLHAVEERSHGRWKAVVVGSYERGDRALSVQRLAELAQFYGVPVTELLPADQALADANRRSARSVIDLEALAELPEGEVDVLGRYVAAIQSMRGDYNGRVLSIRADDIRALSIVYNRTQSELFEQLTSWGVLADGSEADLDS